MEKTIRALTVAFYSVFILLIGYITLASLVADFSPLTLITLLLFLPGIYFIRRAIFKHDAFMLKHYKKLLFFFAAFMLILQIIFGCILRFDPVFDMDAIYGGAIEWVETGTFASYYDYYYYFPNNLGGMSLLYIFFKLASYLGISDFFTVGLIVNSILSVCAMLICSLTAKELGGAKHAVFILAFFLCSLPFYFIAPAFYTDSLSLIFPILIIYLALRLRRAVQPWQTAVFSVLIGLTASIGMMIKSTVIITLLAVIICLLMNKKLLKALVCCLCSACVIIISLTAFNSYFASRHLTDAEKARIQNTPYTHWLMMGLKGTGGYNAADYEFTRSFEDPIERNQAINKEIRRRISELGPAGLIELAAVKGALSMGNGTYALSDFLDDSPVRQSPLHSFLLYSSPYYPAYSSICCGIHLSIMFLAVMSALEKLLAALKKKYTEPARFMAPYIAFFGLALFLLMWETSGRYITNYIPILFICAAQDPELLNRLIFKIKRH